MTCLVAESLPNMVKVPVHSLASKNDVSTTNISICIWVWTESRSELWKTDRIPPKKKKNKQMIPRWPENEGCLIKIKIVMEKKKSQACLLTNITNCESPWWPKLTANLGTCKSAVWTGPSHLRQRWHQMVSTWVLVPVRLLQGCCILPRQTRAWLHIRIVGAVYPV